MTQCPLKIILKRLLQHLRNCIRYNKLSSANVTCREKKMQLLYALHEAKPTASPLLIQQDLPLGMCTHCLNRRDAFYGVDHSFPEFPVSSSSTEDSNSCSTKAERKTMSRAIQKSAMAIPTTTRHPTHGVLAMSSPTLRKRGLTQLTTTSEQSVKAIR